jgi:hypothetical protein
MESDSEVLSGLVVKRIRDGRCRYDPLDAKSVQVVSGQPTGATNPALV